MKPLVFGAVSSAVTTFVAATALRAHDATLAVAAVAAVVVVVSWYAQLASTDDQPGLDRTQPAAALALAVVGRSSWTAFLPLVTAQVVGALAAGLGANALSSRLPEPLTFDSDAWVVAAVAGALAGLVVAWSTLAVDGGGHVGLSATAAIVPAAVSLGLVGAFSPAVVLGIAAAGLITWTAAGIAAAACLIVAGLGAWSIGVLVPESE